MPYYRIFWKPQHRPHEKAIFTIIESPAVTASGLEIELRQAGAAGIEVTLLHTRSAVDGSYRFIRRRDDGTIYAHQIETISPCTVPIVDRTPEIRTREAHPHA